MTRAGWLMTTMGALTLGACVTVNVYFPAVAAEKAADRIIDEVWGEQTGAPAKPALKSRIATPLRTLALAVLEVIVPAASAQQANLEISTPEVNALQSSMSARHALLAPYYDSGAVGLTDDGLVAMHDAKALSLPDRAKATTLVAEENRDRNNLYKAIAHANGHPEWESNIRATFARRWIERAKAGWWYEQGGSWRQR